MQQTPDFSIRYIKPKDRVELLLKVKKVIRKYTERVDDYQLNQLVDKGLENKDFAVIMLVNAEDVPKGYVFCTVSELYFTPIKVACCLSIWVDEDCRKYSLDMIKAFESWAKYKQADKTMFSTFAGVSPEGLGKVFTRQGYEIQEVQYWKDVDK